MTASAQHEIVTDLQRRVDEIPTECLDCLIVSEGESEGGKTPFIFEFSNPLLAAIEATAEEHGISVDDVVSAMLATHLDELTRHRKEAA